MKSSRRRDRRMDERRAGWGRLWASWLLTFAALCVDSSLHARGGRSSTSRHATDGRRVGIVYEPWHAPAYWFMRQNSTTPLSVEEIVRANGSRVLSDVFSPPHNLQQGMGFWWHATPAGGRYCIYRKRDDEQVGYVPDCPNITQTLTRQASELVSAGIDFVVVDSTNAYTCSGSVPDICHASSRLDGPGCPEMSCQGDVLELRPTEVLFEEWAKLRVAGTPTPQIAVWANIPSFSAQNRTATLWQYYLDRLYFNTTYQELGLVFVDDFRNQPVFFVPDNPVFPPDQGIREKIRARGVVVVDMWANIAMSAYAQGKWVFMSPCTTPDTGEMTTSVVGLRSCDQRVTTSSPIGRRGTAVTVSPSYQMNYASLPFQAAGKLGGLTLRAQFQQAFATRPDYLLIASYNEYIAQAQQNPFAAQSNRAVSMGLESDPQNSFLWVDTYGASISRDLEATKELGDSYWKLLESCLRVYRSGEGALPPFGCDNLDEVCCTPNDALLRVNVFSLQLLATPPVSLLTKFVEERAALLNSGAWREVCAPLPDQSVFCTATVPPRDYEYSNGPFLLYANQTDKTMIITPSLEPELPRAAIFRCFAAQYGGKHWVSLQYNCPELINSTAEGLIGYAARERSTENPRSLRLCETSLSRNAMGWFQYHALDASCNAGDIMSNFVGFVH